MSSPSLLPRPQLSILPRWEGDPASRPYLPSEDDSPAEIVRCAETLGIPWKRILLEEIEAEQRLRRYSAEIDKDFSLVSASTILSFSLLRSWRVRDRIERLACEAREASNRGMVRQLRIVFQQLTGKQPEDRPALGQHLGIAYQRVLLLQRVFRAAARSRGTTADRLASVCSSASCSYDDAAWAIGQELSPQRGHRLEAAVRKVREEGFLIPRAETEARSLALLRRTVRALSPGRRRSR